MSEAFGWAFIGAGTLGAKVARQITKSGRHKIVSVYVRNAEKRAAFAKQYGALAASSPEQAMTAPGVDGVYIVTPHTSHFAYAKQALELGKPVLCEKPITTDARQSAELIRLSGEKGVYFTEGMWTWFAPVARKLKEWYDAGEYGEITEFSMRYHLKSIHYAPRVSDPRLAGGALLDIGIYPLTYAWRLMGRPERVECKGTVTGGIDTDEEITHFSLEVSDLKAFRDQVLARGGAPYVETEIEMGLENTWVFWMHDPDGNRFEIMEYTPESYQVVGR